MRVEEIQHEMNEDSNCMQIARLSFSSAFDL